MMAISWSSVKKASASLFEIVGRSKYKIDESVVF